MSSRAIRRVGGLALLAVLLVGVCRPAQARPYRQGTDPTYTGLDLLFLVDQSGSMGGAAFGYPDLEPTDPLQLRFEAVQYALDTLGEYRLLIAPDLAFRAAVINFGDDPVVTLNWTPIASSQAEWDASRASILDQVSATAFGPVNLGNTNFLAAFELAQTMFAALPVTPDQTHLRVIVLLTDGQPCVVSGPNAFACGDSFGQQAHMDAVNALVQTAFPVPDYQIYVLALDATGEVWQTRSSDWQAVVGEAARATLVATNQQVGVQFYLILSQLVAATGGSKVSGGLRDAQQLTPGTNTIFVPPYQRLMRLSLFKSSNSPGVLSITQPNGQPLPSTDPDVTVSNQNRPIEVWTIADPIPGDWVFEVGSQNDRLDVYLELIPLEVTASASGGTFRLYDDVPLSVQLTDAVTQDPLISYPPPYDLTVQAVITLLDGSTLYQPLTSAQSGTYTGTYTANMGGQYTLGVQASITLPTGEDYVIVSQPALSAFTVSGLVLEVDTFPAGDYLVGEAVELSARVVDDTGAVVPDPAYRFTAALVDSLDAVIAPVEFTDPDGDGVYSAQITWTDDMADAGSLYLDVAVDSGTGGVVGAARLGPVRVLPSIMISARVLEPQPGTEQYVTEGFPPLTKTDLDIVFETRRDEDNNLIDVLPLAANPGTPVLSVRLIDDGDTRPLVFEAGDQPGQYRATVSDLPAGTYHVEVTTAGALQGQYIFNPQASTIRVTVERKTNPMLYAFWGGVGLAVALFAAVVIMSITQSIRQRQHPARGQLVIVKATIIDNEQTEIWRRNLDREKSNDIRFGRSKLPREAPITRLKITCDNNRMSEQRQVRVSAWNKREMIVLSRVLTPGSMLTLHQRTGFDFDQPGIQEQVVYHLMKDPDDYGLGGTDMGVF
ncbi:MAG: VWA domain-containing protein [Anaerolineae bacterium]|nr:VWA domain-containing protein [Anaerolineae bacterium]